jgi:hypothetical protein
MNQVVMDYVDPNIWPFLTNPTPNFQQIVSLGPVTRPRLTPALELPTPTLAEVSDILKASRTASRYIADSNNDETNWQEQVWNQIVSTRSELVTQWKLRFFTKIRSFYSHLITFIVATELVTSGFPMPSLARVLFRQTSMAPCKNQILRGSPTIIKITFMPQFPFTQCNGVNALVKESQIHQDLKWLQHIAKWSWRVLLVYITKSHSTKLNPWCFCLL